MSRLLHKKARRNGTLLTTMLLGSTALAALQTFSQHLPGNDGYYHLKMALLLPEIGFTHDFPWLRWTIFHDQFVSHHHGFHTLLAPFAWASQWLTGDAVLGGKLAAAVSMAATFGLLHVTLRELGARLTWVWLLLICAGPWHFWLRMSYVRAPMAALPLMVLAVLWCLRGRTIALGILAFFFTQIYGGAILFPLIPLAFLAAHVLIYQTDRGGHAERLMPAVRQCTAACVGVVLGLVINPYFPANLQFMYTQLFETGLGAPEHVGSEWKTFDGWNLLVQSAPLAALWLWCLVRRLQSGAAATAGEIGLLLLNVVFLVLTLKARRFVEYWPAFAVLNVASFYAVSRRGRHSPLRDASEPPTSAGADVPVSWVQQAQTSNNIVEPPSGAPAPAWQRWVVLAALAAAGGANLYYTRGELEVSHDVPAIREAMAFMRANSAAGSLILTDDWDSFPTCFYFNHHNTYAVGLDPEFTRTRYPALWERYRRITRGEVPASVPADLLPAETVSAEGESQRTDPSTLTTGGTPGAHPSPLNEGEGEEGNSSSLPMEELRARNPSPLQMEELRASSPLTQRGPQGSHAKGAEPCTDRKIRYEDIATCFAADYILVADDHRKLYKALMKQSEMFTPIYPLGITADSSQAPITIFAVRMEP